MEVPNDWEIIDIESENVRERKKHIPIAYPIEDKIDRCIKKQPVKILHNKKVSFEDEDKEYGNCRNCRKLFCRGNSFSAAYWRCSSCREFTMSDILRMFIPIR